MCKPKIPKRESRRAVMQAWRSGAAWRGFKRMVQEKGLRRHRCALKRGGQSKYHFGYLEGGICYRDVDIGLP